MKLMLCVLLLSIFEVLSEVKRAVVQQDAAVSYLVPWESLVASSPGTESVFQPNTVSVETVTCKTTLFR